MKVCEICNGAGHVHKLLCSACQGTGLISLGHESAEQHAALVRKARERAEAEGWEEDTWEPLSAIEQLVEYPRLARKVRRRVTVERQAVA